MLRKTFAIVLLATAPLAACGSSSKPGSSTTASHTAQSIKFSNCMRAHGVPNFPDPNGGGGINFPVGSGINPRSPAFGQAQAMCRKLLPNGGPSPGGAGRARESMLKTSECMRAHGVSGFPDPTTSPPSNLANFSIAEGRPGAFLAVPLTINVNAPVFTHAAKVCGFG